MPAVVRRLETSVSKVAKPRSVQQTRSCARLFPSCATNISSKCWWKRRSCAQTVPRTGAAPRKGDAEGQSKPRHAGCGQEAGLLDARGRTQKTGLRASGQVLRHSSSLKTCPRRKKHQDYSVRRLPGPASWPLCEGVQTPEAHHELFRVWQRTQTQSSATAPRSPRLQMDLWFCCGAVTNGREAKNA